MSSLLRFTALAVIQAVAAAAAQAFPTASEIDAGFQFINRDGSEAIDPNEWEIASQSLFKETDKNQNQQLERSEIPAKASTTSILAQADLDHDGRLSMDEYMMLRGSIFLAADIDHNDYITFVEYELYRLIGEAGWADTNKNGRIEFPELRASLRKIFDDADLNRDGRLTAQEADFLPASEFATYAKEGFLTFEAFLLCYKVRVAGY